MQKWFLTLLIGFSITDASKRKTGEVRYKLNVQETFRECEDYKNEVMDARNLEIEYISTTNSVLNGNIIISSPIKEGTQIVLTVYKETRVEREFHYMVSGDLCSQMIDADTPWAPLFLAMGVNSCPIDARTYPIEKLQFNLDYAKEVMKHEFLGEYYVTFVLQTPAQGIELLPRSLACYGIILSVIDTKNDED